jgi:hypothetical protein
MSNEGGSVMQGNCCVVIEFIVVIQQRARFPLLQQWTRLHRGLPAAWKNATETDRHVHNVFFAHAWGWKEPFTGSVSGWRFFSLLLPHLRTSDKNSYCRLRWWSVSWSTIPRLLWNPRSQGPATGRYPEPDESVAQSVSLILIFIHAGSPSGLFPSGLPAMFVVKSINF